MPASQRPRSVLGVATAPVKLGLVALLLLSGPGAASAAPSAARGEGQGGEAFHALATRCAPSVHPSTLAAIVRTESGANALAIGVNTKGVRLKRQPQSIEEAVRTARWLLSKGYNFDAGLGQINSKNLDWLGLSIDAVFDPCANLGAAATVLAECYARATKAPGADRRPLHAALSCYNTGSLTRGFANGYVARVAGNAGYAVPPISAGQAPLQAEAPAALPAEVPEDSHDPSERPDAFAAQGRDAFASTSEPKSDNAPKRMVPSEDDVRPVRLIGVRK